MQKIFIGSDAGKTALSKAYDNNWKDSNKEVIDYLCVYILENYPNRANEIEKYANDVIKKKIFSFI
jgi:hypothetical protein